MDHRGDKRFRVTARKDFSRLFERGRRASDGLVTLFVLPNELAGGRSRAGIAVSKRHGNAVRRNRIKRICREAFRLTRRELPAGRDYMIVPRTGAKLTVEALRASIASLAAKLNRRPAPKERKP